MSVLNFNIRQYSEIKAFGVTSDAITVITENTKEYVFFWNNFFLKIYVLKNNLRNVDLFVTKKEKLTM